MTTPSRLQRLALLLRRLMFRLDDLLQPRLSGGGPPGAGGVPATLWHPDALRFWLGVAVIGIGTGLSAIALAWLLAAVQQGLWPVPGGSAGGSLLVGVEATTALYRVAVLAAAGLVLVVGQRLIVRLTRANGIDIIQAIWFAAGRLPLLRTLGSAVLSVILVGMGISLGREGAPKQFGAAIANGVSDRARLPDSQRRLLVASGAGAGMAAAYGVPLGGALFALEVLRGELSLRMMLPALATAVIATAVSWLVLPDAPTYLIPEYQQSWSVFAWAIAAGPVIGSVAVLYVRLIAYADRHRPQGWGKTVTPLLAMTALGIVSIGFPQILGNGKDMAQLAFAGKLAPMLLLALLIIKPLATAWCLGAGAPGGLFTPSLAFGAVLGGILGFLWSALWPGVPPGLFAVIGAAAMLAATTQGPISAVVLVMELTSRDRSFVVSMLMAVVVATVVARTLDPRSIYEVRLTEAQVAERRTLRAE